MSETRTIWVCTNCIHHHANGECGDCHNPDGHEGGEPLSQMDHTKTTMGMLASEHSCLDYEPLQERERDECDCETNTFSTSSCDGCGSTYHGERHAMTQWSD